MGNCRKERSLPEYRHLLLLLGWPVYFLLYYLTEHRIPEESCHVVHCTLDDRIPFCEAFAIFYVGWYFLIAGSLIWFLLRNKDSFRKLQTYFIVVQLLASIVFVVYPTRQNLRPEQFPRENLLTGIMGLLYRMDTPTGVCPSLHVAMSLGIASVWLRERGAARWLKVAIALFCLGVCFSVVFVKQHSVIDIIAAIPICLIAEGFVFYVGRGHDPAET